MDFDIGYLHHVGHIVRDMEEGLALYRRLGFHLPPPSYPMISPNEGAPPQPFGAANTHATFRRNFVELVTCISDENSGRIPSDANLVPIHAPAGQLGRITESLGRAVAKLAACLSRFQGLHILVFQTPDADAVASRLSAAGVSHGGANTVRRRVDTDKGPLLEPIRFLEIDDDPAGARLVPEGRLAVAENPTVESLNAQRYMDHPNGAVDLVESVLCVAPAALAELQHRYEQYLARPARSEGTSRVFGLAGSQLTLVADTDLETILPGERAPALPAFVAYAVAVRDLGATEKLLRDNGFPLRVSAAGDLFVPATAALGAAVIFRPISGH